MLSTICGFKILPYIYTSNNNKSKRKMQLLELLNSVKTKKYTSNELPADYCVTIAEEVHYLSKYDKNAWSFIAENGDAYGYATTKKAAIKNLVIDVWAEKYQD